MNQTDDSSRSALSQKRIEIHQVPRRAVHVRGSVLKFRPVNCQHQAVRSGPVSGALTGQSRQRHSLPRQEAIREHERSVRGGPVQVSGGLTPLISLARPSRRNYDSSNPHLNRARVLQVESACQVQIIVRPHARYAGHKRAAT